MYLVTISKPEQILYLSYIGHVGLEDLERGAKCLEVMLAELSPGFRILADLSRLGSMDIACVPAIGKTMELLERCRVGLIVRVIPDPSKDIGFNIIAAFHYKNQPQTVTIETMEEAARLL